MDLLDLLDHTAKTRAFETYWAKLQDTSDQSIDLDTLQLCISLLPLAAQVSNRTTSTKAYCRLRNFIIEKIPGEPDDAQRSYRLAKICSSSPNFGWTVFEDMYHHLALIRSTPEKVVEETSLDTVLDTHGNRTSKAVAYLKLLECSYWLPSDQPHYITPALIQVLVDLLGRTTVDDSVHDALSALLTLLKSPVTIMHGHEEVEVDLCPGGHPPNFQQRLIQQQLWTRLRDLPLEYFLSSSSSIFRTWFRWVCLTEASGVEVEAVYEPLYWERLQTGLLNGFGEQRKYCLGILRQSLLVARRDINTPRMTLVFDRSRAYRNQYDKYCTLFEIIVLDRYQNQIQACLPELTTLLGPGSLISSGWQTTLLSAALTSKVQDGTRKLIGTWYIDFVTRRRGAVVNHESFLIGGLLPWATEGSLFTTSLVSSRQSTTCAHGTALADLISTFIICMQDDIDRRRLFTNVLQFVLDKGGRIFQYNVIYVLKGILKGFKTSRSFIGVPELKTLLRVSRLPGLPEIATDLCITYCAEICRIALSENQAHESVPGYDALQIKYLSLQARQSCLLNGNNDHPIAQTIGDGTPTLGQFLKGLNDTRYRKIQDDAFVPACVSLGLILDNGGLEISQHSQLCEALEALWDEAERQDFRRPVVVHVPPLFFHLECIRLCIDCQSKFSESDSANSLVSMLSRIMQQLKKLSERRSYLASVLMTSLRNACLGNPDIINILPFEDFLLNFIERPPIAKTEFLFEVAAAEMLQQLLPHRDYAAYYGRREGYAYAAVVDVLNRLPNRHLNVAENVMQRLLEPWANQKPPIPIISKWKSSLQLQVMLLLTECCITPCNAGAYLESFTAAMMVESWPRYRYLLEWIIARIYYRYPDHAPRMLDTLASLNDGSPMQIASLMKLGVLVAGFLDSEEYALNLMTQLIPFSAHNRVQIRHEAHWSIPIMWNLANDKGWKTIIDNPAFRALNGFVVSLDRFSVPSSSIRTLKLDTVADYTISDIFQGQYLTVETPDPVLFMHSDILHLYTDDREAALNFPVSRVPLGDPKTNVDIPILLKASTIIDTEGVSGTAPTTFQTKSGFDFDSLLSIPGPPSVQHQRPASVILVASLIDNPTNLGGLSRISESFGLETLYIADARHVAHKDFKATSVTSEKHLPIKELKMPDVPSKLMEWKRDGWTVVGVEQTDRSGILGTEPASVAANAAAGSAGARLASKGKGGDGTLPKKCVLVLGSEKGGISAEVLAVVDRCVEIRTTGVTRSLNVQTAGGIAVYEWWREWGGQP
ncbi:hypothetical protein K504DRAFT_392203 [Pleomassaria siparia CBS 279.74]|uniref:tRNA/rRNA methyltransferase SpoU type domain-containing protein n=1 Tax=Pleomassaria siparia CBS 279.74 TaxID=1314801 RepID=A0A6G1JRY4_9PLEO|nr:hypothetical protein K504DRAFT_392203 [Pleomassaria siparia CBS 279.74]